MKSNSQSIRLRITHVATVALMFSVGVACVYAQQRPVKTTFSGTMMGSTINLQPDTFTGDQNVPGSGTLGTVTFRELHADTATPQPSSSWSSGPYFPTVRGGGVFRFQDGSLLTVTVT